MLRVIGLIFVVLVSFTPDLGVSARQRGMQQRRDPLAPNGRREPGAGREFAEPLTQQERRDMRLVPPGVAFPRVLIRVFRQLDLNDSQRSELEHFATRSGSQMPALHRLLKAFRPNA